MPAPAVPTEYEPAKSTEVAPGPVALPPEVDGGAVAAVPRAEVSLVGRLTGEGNLILASRAGTKLTGCRVTLAHRRVAKVAAIAAGSSVEVERRSFVVDASEGEVGPTVALVRCDQGEGTVRLP